MKDSKKIEVTDELTIDTVVEEHVDEMLELDAAKRTTAPLLSHSKTDVNQNKDSDPLLTSTLETVTDSAPSDSDKAINDPELDPMIDEIVSHESDELLARRDEKNAELEAVATPKRGNPVARVLCAWWHNKVARLITILLIIIALAAVAGLPTTRYAALNMVGVRSSASLMVLDSTTQLPLKSVAVKIGEQKVETNEKGIATLTGVKLGTQTLTISQPGFADITQSITIGLGSNPLQDFTLKAVGTQFTFKIVDYLSGKPITNAQISSDDSTARADSQGKIILTLENGDTTDRKAKVQANGYRSETVGLNQNQQQTVAMVSAKKAVFVSKQSGSYDLYTSDIDGKNRKVLLAAKGNEDAELSVMTNEAGDETAFVSRRDEIKNQDGYVLQTLTLVNVSDGTTLTLDRSERFRLIGWVGNRLVYVRIKAGTSAGNPERYQLVSYDYKTNARLQLATANYFSDVQLIGSDIYYSAINDFSGGVSQFVRISSDNSSKKVLIDSAHIYSFIRNNYGNLNLIGDNENYDLAISSGALTKHSGANPNPGNDRLYADSPNNKRSVWIDNRDGKGVLLTYDTTTKQDIVLVSQAGLTQPIRWLDDNTLIYRVDRTGEIADYVISLHGGEARKITDLTNTYGLQTWLYL